MSTATLPSPTASIWWLFLLQGVAGIVLGLMLITAPNETLIAIVTFLGFYWFFTGILSLVQAFVDRSTPWIWSLISGLLGFAAGLIVLKHPLLAAITVPAVIVIMLGVEALMIGGVNIIAGFQGGGLVGFTFGLVNVLIGLLLLGSPLTAAAATPFVFGAILIVQGLVLVGWAFRVRA